MGEGLRKETRLDSTQTVRPARLGASVRTRSHRPARLVDDPDVPFHHAPLPRQQHAIRPIDSQTEVYVLLDPALPAIPARPVGGAAGRAHHHSDADPAPPRPVIRQHLARSWIEWPQLQQGAGDQHPPPLPRTIG